MDSAKINEPKGDKRSRLKAGCLLVKAGHVRYFLTMLRKFVSLSALAFCVGAKAVQADVVQLKDDAQIMGKILAEKRDQVAIDVGYTVLVIPRNQIEKISRSTPAATPVKTM